MEYEQFQGKSEVLRLKTELKILREVPVNERTNLVQSSYISKLNGSKETVKKLRSDKKNLEALNLVQKKELDGKVRWIEKSKESHQLEIYNIQVSSEEIGRKNIEFYQRDLALNYVSGDEVINRELSQAIASFKNENQELKEKDKGREYELKQLKKMIKKLQRENSDLKGK